MTRALVIETKKSRRSILSTIVRPDMRRDERHHRPAGPKTVAQPRAAGCEQDLIEQPTLKLFEPRLGGLDQAKRAGWLGHPAVTIMAKRLDVADPFAGLAVGEPVELAGLELEKSGQLGRRCDRRHRPGCRRPRRWCHCPSRPKRKVETKRLFLTRLTEALVFPRETGQPGDTGPRCSW